MTYRRCSEDPRVTPSGIFQKTNTLRKEKRKIVRGEEKEERREWRQWEEGSGRREKKKRGKNGGGRERREGQEGGREGGKEKVCKAHFVTESETRETDPNGMI